MNSETQEAFMKGYLAAMRERSEPSLVDQQLTAHRAIRAADEGPGSLITAPGLIGDRAVEGVKSGFLQGLIWAIIGGITGFGLGATVGAPLQGAVAGGTLAGAIGYPIGNSMGQLKADKRHLAKRGLTASRPIPIRELALRPSLSAAAPVTSFTKIREAAQRD